ncbi:hypothetical protein K466DRAFT_264769 [Polyporus arcularius HHB13444]|uniref:Uncharacterized protein n=1 Tax=Polyporus arcularius HHB13444 TaxID=1314778 RepID=A0A5C3P506_9APHY|nr:hypothetical protein K466DRAFT_264769 [Polyporus arcularius HHB13444]
MRRRLSQSSLPKTGACTWEPHVRATAKSSLKGDVSLKGQRGAYGWRKDRLGPHERASLGRDSKDERWLFCTRQQWRTLRPSQPVRLICTCTRLAAASRRSELSREDPRWEATIGGQDCIRLLENIRSYAPYPLPDTYMLTMEDYGDPPCGGGELRTMQFYRARPHKRVL